MGPELGHASRLNDWQGVEEVVSTIIGTAREFVFPGEVEWILELGDRTVRALTFDAYFRLQEDALDWRTRNPDDWSPEESRTMLVVRFTGPDQPLPDEPWSLRVRGDWPSRRDRLPDDSPFSSKSLRTGRGWKNRKKPKKSEAARRNTDDRRSAENSKPKVPWGRHDSLWIAEVKEGRDAQNQFIDLQAQVGLFLLQTNSVPNDGEVRDRLVEYLRSTFRWRGAEEPDADVYVVYNHLLKHKWWLDDRRGWRKLVRACINGVIKSQRRRGAHDRDLAADDQGRLTVDQFARRCGMSRTRCTH